MAADDLPLDIIRQPDEVARRALALYCVWHLAVDDNRDFVLDWLATSKLANFLTPNEKKFVAVKKPTMKQRVDFSWHAERLYVLVWALDGVEELPPHNAQCSTSVFSSAIPPFDASSAENFICTASLRSEATLLEMADGIREAHWKARDARIHGKDVSHFVNIEIIQERHHAINWVTGYDSLPWDDVTADTY